MSIENRQHGKSVFITYLQPLSRKALLGRVAALGMLRCINSNVRG
jgi:hypothetical protein